MKEIEFQGMSLPFYDESYPDKKDFILRRTDRCVVRSVRDVFANNGLGTYLGGEPLLSWVNYGKRYYRTISLLAFPLGNGEHPAAGYLKGLMSSPSLKKVPQSRTGEIIVRAQNGTFIEMKTQRRKRIGGEVFWVVDESGEDFEIPDEEKEFEKAEWIDGAVLTLYNRNSRLYDNLLFKRRPIRIHFSQREPIVEQ